MTVLLKPGKLYKYLGKKPREVLVSPDAYVIVTRDHRGKRLLHPRRAEFLEPGMVFMPIESRLVDMTRWTKAFVGENLGWFMVGSTDDETDFIELLVEQSLK